MTAVLAICVAVTFAVSLYLLLGRELKGIAMGVFLLGHAANLCIIAQSGSPVIGETAEVVAVVPAAEPDASLAPPLDSLSVGVESLHEGVAVARRRFEVEPLKGPPILDKEHGHAIAPDPAKMVDPLPQALILTAIVIGFAVMGFLLALIVVTGRGGGTLDVEELASDGAQPPHRDMEADATGGAA